MKAANSFIRINMLEIKHTAQRALDIIKKEYSVE